MTTMWAFIGAVCLAVVLLLSCTWMGWPQPVCQVMGAVVNH